MSEYPLVFREAWFGGALYVSECPWVFGGVLVWALYVNTP